MNGFARTDPYTQKQVINSTSYSPMTLFEGIGPKWHPAVSPLGQIYLGAEREQPRAAER